MHPTGYIEAMLGLKRWSPNKAAFIPEYETTVFPTYFQPDPLWSSRSGRCRLSPQTSQALQVEPCCTFGSLQLPIMCLSDLTPTRQQIYTTQCHTMSRVMLIMRHPPLRPQHMHAPLSHTLI